MTRFKKVRFRNIMTFGHTWTEIDLDIHDSTMVIGRNGVGKSSCMEAIYFACFGKSFRSINMEKLINRRNKKDLLVELWFDSGETEIMVRRGLSPSIFEVYVNGNLIPQEAKRKYQKILEGYIGCDWLTSRQVLFVGKSNHHPFMKMDSSKRRHFVENVANLLLFGRMSKISGERLSKKKSQISELKLALSGARDKLKVRARYMEELRSMSEDSIERERVIIRERIEDLQSQIDSYEFELSKPLPAFDKKLWESMNTSLSSKRIAASTCQHNIQRMEKELEEISRGTCSKCGNYLENHEQERTNAKFLLDEEEKFLRETHNEIKDLEILVEKMVSMKDAYGLAVMTRERIESDLENVHEKIRKEQKNLEEVSASDKIEKEIKAVETQIQDLKEIAEQLTKKLEIEISNEASLKLMQGILSDSGLKASILAQIIPVLNDKVNQHLSDLGLFASFYMDENFDETIKIMGFDDAPYNSFSEGEKLRIDLAVLLAWRDVARMIGSFDSNLLFFDEIFDSSLDSDGAEALADLMNSTEGLNMIVITHTPEKIADRMERTLKVTKIDGYSKIETL